MSPHQLSSIDSLTKMLTLSHVPRWAIVDVIRHQNVGEHSYRVMAIALSICGFFTEKLGFKVSEGEVLKHAILHDIDESETGDIPTPFKYKAGLSKPKPPTLETGIIGLADLIEAYIYLVRYGVRSDRIAEEIRGKINDKCVDMISLICADRPVKEYIEFRQFISDIIRVGTTYE
jgi:hypothetical protein